MARHHSNARGKAAPSAKPTGSARVRRNSGRQLSRRGFSASRVDPFEHMRRLGERPNRIGFQLGLAAALLVHGAAAAHGLSSLLAMRAFSSEITQAVREDLRATYRVEVDKKPPPPQPEPEPPKPEPQPRAPAPAKAKEPSDKPPAPAEAGKVLTANPDDDVVDLTDEGFVTGEGERFAGGVTAATGTSKTAVRDTAATKGGVPGGTGRGPRVVEAPPAEDLSRAPTPASKQWNDCGFPPEADVEQIDYMRVKIVVTVDKDGRAGSVTVVNDPGHGFGRLARQCALRKRYNVGLDKQGNPVTRTTPPFDVIFQR